MSKDFYSKLIPFGHFEEFTRKEIYHALPEDWLVVVADIRNSTKAIDDGFYREVNLIGAASITQTMLSIKSQNIPFVFGGDGASLCIHRDDVAAVSEQLGKLQNLSLANFGLELRVAIIPVQEIRNNHYDILIAKLEITEQKFIALFRGGGLAEADKLAKREYEKYAIAEVKEELDSLAGLSCRWSPIPSKKGQVVSLLVMARDIGALDVYQELISKFRLILGREISETNPVLNNLTKYKSMSQALAEESMYHRSWFSKSFLARVIDVVLAVLIFKYRINPVPHAFDAKNYLGSVSRHSDFRKFDDTLRLIMDCSVDEMEGLKRILERSYQEGILYYGLFSSDQALMTCFVETTQQGGHLHFIDGGDGGLAMAARQLKMQMSGD